MFNVLFAACRSVYALALVLSLLVSMRLIVVEAAAGEAAGSNVLASIKPLQLIAQAVTHGISDAGVLLPAGRTPHDYALKPSDLMRVYSADLVLWLGESYEVYLAKPLAMRNAGDLAVLDFDEAAEVQHENHEYGEHSHLYGDLHVWFSPAEALAIAQALTDKLAQNDAANAARYSANLAVFKEQLSKVDEHIKDHFAVTTIAGYLVYHDAYSYFEGRYGLTHLAAVTRQPDSKPGAKKLLSLRKAIVEQQVKCLFTEPQSDPDIVAILTEGSELQVIPLDPMAGDIAVSAEGYIKFLEHTASRFAACEQR